MQVTGKKLEDIILFVEHNYLRVCENTNVANTRWFPQCEIVFKGEEFMFVKQSIIRIGLYSIFTPLEKRAYIRGRLPIEYSFFTIVIHVILSSLKIPSFQL